MKKTAIIALAAALVAGLVFFFLKVKAFSDREHERFQATLWQLKHLDTLFNEVVLEARFALADNYDDLDADAEQTGRTLEDLKITPAFIDAAGQKAIESARLEYKSLLAQRVKLFERFKSQNATLANSRRYLPVALEELARRLGDDPFDRELGLMANDLTRLALNRLTSPDEAPEQTAARLNRINDWCARHPDRRETAFFSSLARHARIIVTGSGEVDTLTRQLLALPSEASIQKLSQAYELNVAQAMRRAQQYRLPLYVLSFLAVVGLVCAFWALRSSNRRLEHRVQERTRELANSEERFRLIVENVKDYAILILDTEGKVTSWNTGAEKIKGYKAEEIIGRHFSQFYPPEAQASGEPQQGLVEALAKGQIEDEGWRVRKDGSRFFANVIITPIYDALGRHRGFGKITRDISERKHVEEKLADQAAELKRSNQELEQFAYVASHDMREPLRAVTGFAQILKKNYHDKLDKAADGMIGHIVEGAKRMADLIDDLLALSSIGAKGKPFENSALEKPLAVALESLSVAIQERGAIVRHDALPTLPVDASQMALLFQNLIGNAVKFCRDRPPEIHIGATHGADGFWTISLRDNGIGMEAKYFERIFAMFQRLHTRNEYPGTGIGLAICKKIVERHGGRIWPESAPGKGTTFYFVLPDRHTEYGQHSTN
jgi:PAS domain S-box-containing protein